MNKKEYSSSQFDISSSGMSTMSNERASFYDSAEQGLNVAPSFRSMGQDTAYFGTPRDDELQLDNDEFLTLSDFNLSRSNEIISSPDYKALFAPKANQLTFRSIKTDIKPI